MYTTLEKIIIEKTGNRYSNVTQPTEGKRQKFKKKQNKENVIAFKCNC